MWHQNATPTPIQPSPLASVLLAPRQTAPKTPHPRNCRPALGRVHWHLAFGIWQRSSSAKAFLPSQPHHRQTDKSHLPALPTNPGFP